MTGASTANFYYDAGGKQVKTVVNGVTTYYIGNHYEVKNSVVTKYYFASTTRLAVRTGGTLSYLLGDHIGSSSVTTDANGAKTASALYKAFGETRYSLGNLGTDYKFTGQREEASLGIYLFNARWLRSVPRWDVSPRRIALSPRHRLVRPRWAMRLLSYIGMARLIACRSPSGQLLPST